MNLITSILDKYLTLNPDDRARLDIEFTRLTAEKKAALSQSDPRGQVARLHTGNVEINATGVTIYNPDTGKRAVVLKSRGDAFFGKDVDLPPDTSFVVFSNNQRYNFETIGKGDVLLGDNTAGAANVFWDRSAKRLKFRIGTTDYAFIDTSGGIKVGDGIILDGTTQTIYVGATEPRIVIDGANKLIKSSDYAALQSGFAIDAVKGNAEFNNILARGEFAASVFKVSELTATAGIFGVFPSAASLYSHYTSPGSIGNSNTMQARNSSAGASLFAANDILRIQAWAQTAIRNTYYTVTAVGTNFGEYTEYTVRLESGATSAAYKKGTGIVDYGPNTGAGWLVMDAEGLDAPNLTIREHSGSPWSAAPVKTRLGNMYNTYGTGANKRFGVGIGDFSSGNYLSYNAEQADKFIIRAGNNAVLVDADGVTFTAPTASSPTARVKWKSGSTELASVDFFKDSTDLSQMELAVSPTSGYASSIQIFPWSDTNKLAELNLFVLSGSGSAAGIRIFHDSDASPSSYVSLQRTVFVDSVGLYVGASPTATAPASGEIWSTSHVKILNDSQLNFKGTSGGGGGGVSYDDTGGTPRFGLIFPGSDVVKLANRASNGVVKLAANTSTAGTGGEVDVIEVQDDTIIHNTREVQQTNVIRQVFSKALTDATITGVFQILTTNESGDNDGGYYTCEVTALILDGDSPYFDSANGVSTFYKCAFSRAMQSTAAGVNSTIDVILDGADASTGAGRTITSIAPSLFENSEFDVRFRLNVTCGGAGTPKNPHVIAYVTLIWGGFQTAPTMAIL